MASRPHHPPPGGSADDHDDRIEAAEQRVTALLQQVDDNLSRAHTSASKLLPLAREFTAHAKAAQASLGVWVNFFRSFEECEKRRFMSGELTSSKSEPIDNVLDVTADSLPSFFTSPRTPCLDDSMRAGFKRRYGSPGMPGDTPSFGCSPPKSVKVPHVNASDDSGIAMRMSPVGQPVFAAAPGDSSVQADVSFGSVDDVTARAVCGGNSSIASTPTMSSPTRTVRVEGATVQAPQLSGAGGPGGEARAAALRSMGTPGNSAGGAAGGGAATPKEGATPGGRSSRRATPGGSARKAGGTGDGGDEPEGEMEEEGGGDSGDPVLVNLPELALSSMPPVFRSGEGAKQILRVYSLFGCKGVGQGDMHPSLSFDQVAGGCRGFEKERVRWLLDSLVARRVLRRFECLATGGEEWQFAGKENA